jgi:hypothetical protein
LAMRIYSFTTDSSIAMATGDPYLADSGPPL